MGNSEKDVIVLEGVIESIVKDLFKVVINENHTAMCKPSGRLRQSGVKCVPGDRVRVELSVYDTCKGRVIFRLKD